MAGYVKLFSSILDSTLWGAPPTTCKVWITMLAMSDRDGVVEASVPGLARRAIVTIPECEAAIALFLAPDPHSRTPDHEGRRIAVIDGGWCLLNYEKYREKASGDDLRNKAAERQRRFKERRKKRDSVTLPVTPGNAGNVTGNAQVTPVTPGNAGNDNQNQRQNQETESDPPIAPPPGGAPTGLTLTPPVPPAEAPKRREIPAHLRAGAARVLDLLNAARKRVIKGAHDLRPTDENLRYIAGRLDKGATEDECAHVIAVREAEVRGGGDPKWFDAITPFRADNFAKSLAQTGEVATHADAPRPASHRILPLYARPPEGA